MTAYDDQTPDEALVPTGVRAAAGWTWRILLVAAGVYALLQLLSAFEVLVVPVLVALLLVAFLAVRDLVSRRAASDEAPARAGLPRGPASLLAILVALLVVAGLIALIGQQMSSGFSDLRTQSEGWDQLRETSRPARCTWTAHQLDRLIDQRTARSGTTATGWPRAPSGWAPRRWTSGPASSSCCSARSSSCPAGAHLALGRRPVPRGARPRVDGAGVRAWATLTSYVRATVVVAVVDGAGVGIVGAGRPAGAAARRPGPPRRVRPRRRCAGHGSSPSWWPWSPGPVVAALMLAGVVAVQQTGVACAATVPDGSRGAGAPARGVSCPSGPGCCSPGIPGAPSAAPISAVADAVAFFLVNGEPDAGRRDGAEPLAAPGLVPAAAPAGGTRTFPARNRPSRRRIPSRSRRPGRHPVAEPQPDPDVELGP